MRSGTYERTLPNASNSHASWFTASRVTLVMTLLAAPLAFGAVQPWAWATTCILCGVALVLWAIGCAARGRISLALSTIDLALALGLALVAGQLVYGKTADSIGTRESLIKLAAYFTVFFLARHLSTGLSPRALKWFSYAILSYVFAMSVFAIVQFFSNPGLIYWTVKPRWGGAIFGPYVNHNHYAGLLEVLLPFAIGGVLTLSQRLSFPWLGAFAVVLGLTSVLLCGSRSGTVGVIIELTLFLAVIVSQGSSELRRMPIVISLGVAMIAAVLFAWLDPGHILRRWEATARAPEIAYGPRRDMGADSMRMLRQNAVVGVGAGAYEVAYPTYQSWITGNIVDHAHNDYAELLAETGAAGGMLMLTSITLFCCQAFSCIGRRLLRADGWMQIAAAIACCGLLVHSFTDFNLHIPANAAWFALAAGISLSFRSNTQIADESNCAGHLAAKSLETVGQ